LEIDFLAWFEISPKPLGNNIVSDFGLIHWAFEIGISRNL